MSDKYSMRVVRVGNAESTRERGERLSSVQIWAPGGIKARPAASGRRRRILAIQRLGFDEPHDLAPCRLLYVPQQPDVVEGPLNRCRIRGKERALGMR